MAFQHASVLAGSQQPASLFLGLVKTRQPCQLYSACRTYSCRAWRRKSAGCRRWRGVESRLALGTSLRSINCGRSLGQVVLQRVLERGDHVSRNVVVRSEPQANETREKVDYKMYQALIRGGEEVTEMMKEMAELLEDIAGFDKEEEEAAVRMAAAGVVGKKLDSLEGNFMLALDWMIEQTKKEKDDQKQKVLDLIKETVMAQLSQKFPTQVQVVGALCTTSCKDARQEILRRCAGGGGTFKTEKGDDIQLPGANLNDIANQADDIISNMEEKPLLPDRRLLAKLVLVREEARSLLSGGILDERNDNKGFTNLPEPEVNFLSKLVALKPGPPVRERLAKVMRGKEEGKERPVPDRESQPQRRRRFVNISNDASPKEPNTEEGALRPVRPGIFLETLTKLIAGMYASNTAVGVTVQQLEWIHKITLDILQEMAYL